MLNIFTLMNMHGEESSNIIHATGVPYRVEAAAVPAGPAAAAVAVSCLDGRDTG